MLKSRLLILFLIAIAVLAAGVLLLPATAAAAPPECPDSFMPVMAGEHHHEGDHEHHDDHLHVGLWPDADRNGDGNVCVKHQERGGQHIHVFVDNIAR